MKKRIKTTLILLISAVILISGGYVGNMFGIFSSGNYGDNKLSKTASINSSLEGKNIIFLGSSVTYGYGSMGVSFVDFLEEGNGIIALKEAVSGTTLADIKDNSYVSRLKKIDKSFSADAFVCQLSTNDATKNIPLGKITDSYDTQTFDTQTVSGAIEYIISYANEVWNCPVVFYTQAKYESDYYGKMVELLYDIQKKWDIHIIDLWHDDTINDITEEQRKLYLVDSIHPTKAGYKEWWLPSFIKCLNEVLK